MWHPGISPYRAICHVGEMNVRGRELSDDRSHRCPPTVTAGRLMSPPEYPSEAAGVTEGRRKLTVRYGTL